MKSLLYAFDAIKRASSSSGEIPLKENPPLLAPGAGGMAVDMLLPYYSAHRGGKAMAMQDILDATGHGGGLQLSRYPMTSMSLIGGAGAILGGSLGAAMGPEGGSGAGFGAGAGGLAGGLLAGYLRNREKQQIRRKLEELYEAGEITDEDIIEHAGAGMPEYGVARNVMLPMSGFHRAGWQQGRDFLRDGQTQPMSSTRGVGLAGTEILSRMPLGGLASIPAGWTGNIRAQR